MKGLRVLLPVIFAIILSGGILAQQPSDDAIKAELQKRISPAARITIAVQNGVVTLSGAVSAYAQKHSFLNTAGRTVGVKEVVDRLTVVPAQKRTDDEITRSVRSVLIGNLSREEMEAVTIRVQNSVVILGGTLSSSYPKSVAGILAGWVPGVVDVRNQIAVKPSVARTDLEIQADVAERFGKNPFISKQRINVTVTKGVVALTGIVDNFLASEQAESVARFAPGVVDVINLIFVRAMGV